MRRVASDGERVSTWASSAVMRDGHVRGMGGDAGVARAEDGVHAVEPPSAAQPEPGWRLLQGLAVS